MAETKTGKFGHWYPRANHEMPWNSPISLPATLWEPQKLKGNLGYLADFKHKTLEINWKDRKPTSQRAPATGERERLS